jgi:hypothetical protein
VGWTRSHVVDATDNPGVDVLCGAIRIIDRHGRASLRARTSDPFNLAHYAAGVRSLTVTEPEAPMAKRLQKRILERRPNATLLRAPSAWCLLS